MRRWFAGYFFNVSGHDHILGGMTGMFQGRRLTLPTIIPDEVVQRVEETKAAKKASRKESRTIATAKS